MTKLYHDLFCSRNVEDFAQFKHKRQRNQTKEQQLFQLREWDEHDFRIHSRNVKNRQNYRPVLKKKFASIKLNIHTKQDRWRRAYFFDAIFKTNMFNDLHARRTLPIIKRSKVSLENTMQIVLIFIAET